MKKILPSIFFIALFLALALMLPKAGITNLYVDSSSECMTCHTIVNPLTDDTGSEGEQHYDHDGKPKNPDTDQVITCLDCHDGALEAGNVPAAACVVCHFEKCKSITTHQDRPEEPATCLTSACHAECATGDDDDDDTGDDDDDDDSTGTCPSESIYGSDSEEAEIMRDFRDNVLNKTAAGRKIINAYYQVAPMLNEAMESNNTLKAIIKMNIDAVLGLIK